MKYHYSLMAISLFAITFLLSCKKEPISPASASLIVAKNEVPLRKGMPGEVRYITGTLGKTVWICQSAASKRYHYKASCRGLKRCTHTILKTTVERAKAVGLTMCGFEK